MRLLGEGKIKNAPSRKKIAYSTLLSFLFHLSFVMETAWGATETDLKRFFEGKQVLLKMDMPATKEGVDIYYRRDPPIDFKTYSQRIKKFGVALRNGDRPLVTTVRVKGRNLEFQLSGGGYGTLGDDTAAVYLPSVSKSNREVQLEKDVKKENDPVRREQLEKELNRLREIREREDARRQTESLKLEAQRQREIEEKRLQAGSRFNIWFPSGYLPETAPTPDEVMDLLEQYIDFGDLRRKGPGNAVEGDRTSNAQGSIPDNDPAAAAQDPAFKIRRGLTREQVHTLFGSPTSTFQRKQGDLTVVSDTWDNPAQTTVVDFVGSVVIKYTVSFK
jgi:hypothetical protein